MADTLRSGRAQWLRGTEFRCRYRLTSGVLASSKEALDGATRSERLSEIASGVYFQKGDRRRISCEYPKPAEVVGVLNSRGFPVDIDAENAKGQLERGQKGIVRRAGFDELSDLARSVIFRPFYDQAVFAPRDLDEGQFTECDCTDAEIELSPFNPTRACEIDIFSATGEQKFDAGEILEVSHTDDNHILTVSKSRRVDQNRTFEQVSRIIWWTKPTIPVIEQIDRVITTNRMPLTNLMPMMELSVRLSDFVKCPGGYVPRNVLYFSKDVTLERASEQVRVWEWRSSDLGVKLPSDDDFVLSVPASTVVVGLIRPPPPGTKRQLTLEMFDAENGLRPAAPRTRPAPR